MDNQPHFYPFNIIQEYYKTDTQNPHIATGLQEKLSCLCSKGENAFDLTAK